MASLEQRRLPVFEREPLPGTGLVAPLAVSIPSSAPANIPPAAPDALGVPTRRKRAPPVRGGSPRPGNLVLACGTTGLRANWVFWQQRQAMVEEMVRCGLSHCPTVALG